MAVSKLDVNYTFLVYVWMIPDKSITQNNVLSSEGTKSYVL
jgi:hypothetical protein